MQLIAQRIPEKSDRPRLLRTLVDRCNLQIHLLYRHPDNAEGLLSEPVQPSVSYVHRLW